MEVNESHADSAPLDTVIGDVIALETAVEASVADEREKLTRSEILAASVGAWIGRLAELIHLESGACFFEGGRISAHGAEFHRPLAH